VPFALRLLKEADMSRLACACAVVSLLVVSAGAAETPEDAAQAAAESWLELVDGGRYEASWQQAASLFRGAVTSEQWQQAASGVRDPLGRVVSRRLKSRERTQKLPGAPDGDYVVIQYDTVFEKKASAVETVTPMLDADGRWRVSGYFIR
jgi:hypothetical protein